MRALLIRGVVAFLAATGAVVTAEALLRIAGVRPFPSWSPRFMHIPDERLGLRLAPNFSGRQETSEFSVVIETNRIGLRSPEISPGSRPDVCLLGDSFAFGHGVDQESMVASRLQERTGLTVVNAGVMSYGTWQAVGLFRDLAVEISPKLVVLLFYAGNDVLDNGRPGLTVRDGYVMSPNDELTAYKRVKLWLKTRSTVYKVVARFVDNGVIEGACDSHASFGFAAFRRQYTSETERAWQSTMDALRELKAACASTGSGLLIVCIPTRYQVEDSWWDSHVARCAFRREDFDLRKVQDALRAFCERSGIGYLDTLEVFRLAPRSLYYQSFLEMHLNADGHALLAAAMADRIVEEVGSL